MAFAIFGSVFFASCAQEKEEREEFKEEHSVEHKRNAGVDSAAFNNDSQVEDSLSVQ